MQAAALDAPRSRTEAEVLRIRALLGKNKFVDALTSGLQLLEHVPENRDVLYMIAVSQRYLKRVPEALATLVRLEAVHPNYSRLFQERGHCAVAAGDPNAAVEAYLRAVNLNPALPASWKALQVLFHSAGEHADAELAARHVAALAKLPAAVVTARSMFADGETHQAERVLRAFLMGHVQHVEAMRLLAQIGMKLDILDDAELLLHSVLQIEPDYHAARHDYANVLLRRHRHAAALEQVERLLETDPANRNYRTLKAAVCVGLGEHESALCQFRELAAETPQAADLHLSMAHALKTLGRPCESVASYRTAAAVRAGYGEAYWSLANLKTYRFTDDEIAAMRTAETAVDIGGVDRYHLCFALGKALEDRADYAESFNYYERGNALKLAEIDFKIEPIERNTRLQRATCSRALFDARRGAGSERADPIFIVGLPRSGSTLLEQILASHSQVEGTMELADVPRLVQTLQGRGQTDPFSRYPVLLPELDAAQLRRFGEKYLADTQVYRSGKAFFIDKMPNNFRHLGLIHLILPNAKIIDARREAMACCFGNFKQLFASGQEFTYSLTDIARYYRTYVELMEHWNSVLPGKILRVDYESVVDDLDGSVRRLLDFCGLDFEPACLEFHRNSRSVRTASAEQVRQPIYKDGVDQWRRYEPWLEPLKQALGPLARH